MAKKKGWIITTSGERSISDISRDLIEAGLIVNHTLEEIGVITGLAEERDTPRLRKIRGVVDVSEDASVNVGPPDSPDTW